jgi:hypothetical protein
MLSRHARTRREQRRRVFRNFEATNVEKQMRKNDKVKGGNVFWEGEKGIKEVTEVGRVEGVEDG